MTGEGRGARRDRPYNVLFLCTGNSARSIMAEALLNHWGAGRFRAMSGGSHPKGFVHPLTLEVLKRVGLSTTGLRSKSWDEFSGRGAQAVDVVITVCGRAAAEACPVWPGRPDRDHWPVDDPAAVQGTEAERRRAFAAAYRELESRVRSLVSLPLERLESR